MAIAALALLPSAAAAWTQPQALSGVYAHAQRVAATATGGSVVAWIRPVGGGDYQFESRTRAADGTLGPVQVIAAHLRAATTGTILRPPRGDVEVDDAGRAVFVWNRGTRIQTRERAAGGMLGPVQSIYRGAEPHLPQVAVNAAGDAAFVWAEYLSPGTRVQARLEAADGTLGPLRTLTRRVSYVPEADVGIDASGDALFVWDANGAHVEARALSTSGAMSSVRAISPRDRHAFDPRLAVDPAGGAAFAWRIATTASGGVADRVQARTYAPNGHLGQAKTLFPWEALNPDVGIDDDGNALIAWEGGVVRARSLSAAGALGPVRQLSGAVSSSPRVAVDSAGNGVIAWTYGAGTDRARVQARKRAADGTLGKIHDFVTGEPGCCPELDMDPSGHAGLAWLGDKGTESHSTHVMASVGP